MKIIIIGNGVAGISAAEIIRNKDKNAEIIIFSDEKYYHYSRPRVIEYLSGKIDKEKLIIRNKDFYEQNNIKIHLGMPIKFIDTKNKKIITEEKEEDFDKLIIAAGAYSFLPSIDGIDEKGVFTLRTIDDADRIIDYSKNKKNAIVIGGGLLGIEAAMSLKILGLNVIIVEVFDRLLPRQLDKESAAILQNMIEEKGLKFLLLKQIVSIEKKNEILRANFKDGTFIEGDLILFSAGIRSNLKILEGTEIIRDKGIKVNEYMQTNIPDIFAAGDIAEYNGIVYGIWPAAREQGIIAGLNVIGEKTEYKGSVISTKLKVVGIELASIGKIEKTEGVEVYIKQEKNIFKKIFLKDKKIIGAILIGDTKQYQNIQESIKNNIEIENIENL